VTLCSNNTDTFFRFSVFNW